MALEVNLYHEASQVNIGRSTVSGSFVLLVSSVRLMRDDLRRFRLGLHGCTLATKKTVMMVELGLKLQTQTLLRPLLILDLASDGAGG